MTLEQIAQAVQAGGLVFGMLGILVAGYKRIWVWGSELTKTEKDRDEWKAMALRSINVAEKQAG